MTIRPISRGGCAGRPIPTVSCCSSRSRQCRGRCGITTAAASSCSASYWRKSPGARSMSSPERRCSPRLGSRIGGGGDWAARPGPAASSRLLVRPRDLAKIGQLVLNRGLWRGRRIVSAAWIKEMTTPQIPPWWLLNGEAGAQSYGYLWWRGRSWARDRPFEWIGGLGWGGQRLYVMPRLDMVVVVTAGAYYRPSYAQDLVGERALAMALRAALTH